MSNVVRIALLWLACLVLAPTSTAAKLANGDRAAVDIAADIEAALKTSAKAVEASGRGSEAHKAALTHFCELVPELQRVDPTYLDLPKWATLRWAYMAQTLDKGADADVEITKYLEANPKGPLDWQARSSLVRVRMVLARGFTDDAVMKLAAAFDDVALRYDGDPELADLFYDYADFRRDNPRAQIDLLTRFVAKYPKHRKAGAARERLTQLGRVDQVFELEFTDALSGKAISVKDLRGKVVVVDFWATWCVPCLREMPHMKELYAKYKDEGVEFLGVSLDKSEAEGGRQALLDLCKAQGLTWPQYYQGNYQQSAFSSSWGIHSIPAVFLIDHEGKLTTTNARGQLDTLIPAQLEKARAARK